MSCDEKAKARRKKTQRVTTIGRLARFIGASLLVALAASCGPKDKPIPADPKARSEFLTTAGTRLAPEERNLLNRFSTRLDVQAASGGVPPQITVPRALELQRTYETQVTDAQRNFQKLLGAATAELAIEVRDATVVKDDKTLPAGEKALRYVVNVNNRSQRTVEQLALRVEFRDASGKYQAAIPELELAGTLGPGEVGRSVQMLPLDAQRHQYILDGKPLRITAYPTRVVYAGGENLEPGKELQTLETLHRAKIE
jgi:hypothetical protein